MKNKSKRFLGAAVAGLMLCSALPVSAAYQSGIYEGSGEGFRGNIKVAVTISDNLITDINVTENMETANYWSRAYPEMANRIIAAQSTNVDTVSRATYSSRGIIAAVNQALEKAEVTDPVPGLDKSALQSAIDRATALNQGSYTAESWQVMVNALTEANSAMSSEDISQEVVNSTAAALNSAIDALVASEVPGDATKEALQALVTQAEAIDLTGYSRTTANAMSTAIRNANRTIENAEATAETIADNMASLQNAIAGLTVYTPGDKYVSTLDDLKLYATDMQDGETLYITENIDATTSATMNTYANITIDGQGHTLNGMNEHGFVYVRGGELTIKNTTFKDATQIGRGNAPIAGAAVYARGGDCIMENCTILGNTSRQGAVWAGSNRKMTIINCTFMDNEATSGNGASVSVGNDSTLVMANSVMIEGGGSDLFLSDSTEFVDAGYNLISTSNRAEGFAETTTVDTVLNRHGRWITHSGELRGAFNSPALNKIPADNEYLPTADRRGIARPQDSMGDIGSFEVETVALETFKISDGAVAVVARKDTLQLSIAATPSNSTQQVFTWVSKNPAVATVSESGLVTPVKAGMTVITATHENGTRYSVTVRVTA